MAEDDRMQEKSLEELEREITCGICQEHYTEPKILPCLHYYCKQCVLRLALKTASGQPFSCPECRCEASLPEGGVDELKTAFFVNRLKSKVISLERTHGKVEVKCELCVGSSDSAKAFCRQCARFICQECVDLHKRITTFQSHQVATLDDLKHGRAQPILVQEPPTEKCLLHGESLAIYCYDCDTLICRDCTVKDHREHNFEFTKKAAPDEKTKLLVELNALINIQNELLNTIEDIHTAKIEVEAQKKSSISKIKISFKELHDILDKREKELVEEAENIVLEKVDKLSVQEKAFKLSSSEVQVVLDYTERCVRHCTDNEVMSMHTEMRKKIQQKVQEHSKSGRNLEPVEEADVIVEVRLAEALRHLCQTQANVKLPDSTPTRITAQKRQASATRKISCQMKSSDDSVVTDLNVVEDESGKFSFQLMPMARGPHELTVAMDEMVASSFPVFVSVSPTRLGKPITVWDGVLKPTGIIVNSKGDILVSEEGGSIIKLSNSGRREKLVTQSDLKELSSVAVDNEDKIYCIDNESNKILTCDANGKNGRVFQVEQKEGGIGRKKLVIMKNKLLISEQSCKGIVVYNRELKRIGHILHDDMNVADIAADESGNIYVTDSKNSCIKIFDASGGFLRSFHHDELKYSRGIWASGKNVYITDYGNHCVSVFSTDGVFVYSFGQRGSEEGEFKSPYYLCTDKDNYLYVCDYGNDRIQCFCDSMINSCH